MVTSEQLINSMNKYGVNYLIGEKHPESIDLLSPEELMAGLVVQSDARLNSALIAVLLLRPDLAVHANRVSEHLNQRDSLLFKIYYSAAHILHLIYQDTLDSLLSKSCLIPDLYSGELGIETGVPADEQLNQLGDMHKEVTGLLLNWVGSYHAVAQKIISRKKKEQEWATV